MNKSSTQYLPLILITAFLDILGFGILIPSLPDIIAGFAMNGSWTAYSQGIYSVWMFFGGLIFWRMSDIYGRKRMLVGTSIINFLWYAVLMSSLFFAIPKGGSWVYYPDTNILFIGFSLYLLSRLVAGFGWAGFSVIQAYIADISSPENKTKNMGLIGAMFWMGFLVWPAIGWILGGMGIFTVVIGCMTVILINIISIIFLLSEPEKHQASSELSIDIHESFRFSHEVRWLLVFSFFTAIGFSSIQSGSNQFYADKFGFWTDGIGYVMSWVGFISIIYQWWLVRYIRLYFNEIRMIQFAFAMLLIGFLLFSLNSNPWFLLGIIPFFPIGMGSFNPSVSALLSMKAWKDVGKVMWYNTSAMSIGWVIGPFLVGFFYVYDISFPFYASTVLFCILFVVSLWIFQSKYN